MTKVFYERIPLKADAPAKDSFRVPRDVIDRLGNDDVPGAAILADVLKISPLHGGTVGPEVLERLGDGSHAMGVAVLKKFIAAIRAKERHGRTA
ncbi:MAG TPA: hypothetical protein VI137_16815 [Pseudolabrys sp.]